jgi:hypothetical protein
LTPRVSTCLEPIPITGVARASSPWKHRQDAGATPFSSRMRPSRRHRR